MTVETNNFQLTKVNISFIFKFGVFTEITSRALLANRSLKEKNCTKVFACEDTNNFWIAIVYNTVGGYELNICGFSRKGKKDKLTITKVLEFIKNEELDDLVFFVFRTDTLDKILEKLDSRHGLILEKIEQ